MPKTRHSDSRFLWIFCSALVGLALGAALVWWGVYAHHHRVQTSTIERLSGQLEQARLELGELHAELGVLEGRLAVESSTRQALERTLGTVQQELGAARDQIAFFYELMPPGPDGSISIRGFDVQRQGELLSFRVLLMRHGARDTSFEGMLQFQATGQRKGETVAVTLEPARLRDPANAGPIVKGQGGDSGPGSVEGPVVDGVPENSVAGPLSSVLTLRFDQFQRSAGLLQIPEGLILESVTLNVLEGDTLRVSRTIEMPVQAPEH